jgi:hypothetical protein
MDLCHIIKNNWTPHVWKDRTIRTRIKKKVCFVFGEKGHIASRHLCISGRDFAARRFILICVYLCKSACPVQFFAEDERSGFNQGVPKFPPPQHRPFRLFPRHYVYLPRCPRYGYRPPVHRPQPVLRHRRPPRDRS